MKASNDNEPVDLKDIIKELMPIAYVIQILFAEPAKAEPSLKPQLQVIAGDKKD